MTDPTTLIVAFNATLAVAGTLAVSLVTYARGRQARHDILAGSADDWKRVSEARGERVKEQDAEIAGQLSEIAELKERLSGLDETNQWLIRHKLALERRSEALTALLRAHDLPVPAIDERTP